MIFMIFMIFIFNNILENTSSTYWRVKILTHLTAVVT